MSSSVESIIVWNAIQSAVATIAPPKQRKSNSDSNALVSRTTRAASSKVRANNNNTSSTRSQNVPRSASNMGTNNNNNNSRKESTLSKTKQQADTEKQKEKEKENRRAKQEEEGLDLLQIGKDEDEQIAAVVSPLVMSNSITPEAGVFIEECIRGIVKYYDFLDATLETLCDIKKRNRAMFPTLRIFLYLVLFRLDEIGAKGVQNVASNNVADTRALEILESLADPDLLKTHFIPKWITLYDDTFVKKVIVERKIKNQSNWAPLAAYFRTRATLEKKTIENQQQQQQQSNNKEDHDENENAYDDGQYYSQEQGEAAGFDQDRLAQMREYELRMKTPPKNSKNIINNKNFVPTAPKAGTYQRGLNKQSAAVSSDIKQLQHVRDPLDYPGREKELEFRKKSPPKEAVRVVREAAKGNRFASTLNAEARDKNREDEQQDRMKIREFVATERPMQMDRLLAEQAEREANERTAAKCPPVHEVRQRLLQHRSQPVKMTQAALLRENALYKKSQEEERLRLEQAERELRSADDFESWRTSQHQQSEQEKLTNALKRKLEAQLIDEKAREAKKLRQERNAEVTREVRQQERDLLDQLKQEQRELEMHNRGQAIEQKHHLIVAKNQAIDNVRDEKLAAGTEVRLQNEKGQKEIAVRLELERQRRAELTEQLKKAHSELCARRRAANQVAKELELKELRAMTIDEVQEKLQQVRQEAADWTEQQHGKIQEKKGHDEIKKKQLEEQVMKHRQHIVTTKTEVRSAKQIARDEADERRKKIEDDRVLELQAQLQQKREARMKETNQIRQADKSRKIAAMLLEADEAHVESKRFAEIEQAMERRAIESQKAGIKENVRSVRLHDREGGLRQKNIDTKMLNDADDRARRDEIWLRKLDERQMADQRTLDSVQKTVQFESSLQRERRIKAATSSLAKDFSKVM